MTTKSPKRDKHYPSIGTNSKTGAAVFLNGLGVEFDMNGFLRSGEEVVPYPKPKTKRNTKSLARKT
jgi:hypothetical protein